MGAGREGFDLFNENGRRNFLKRGPFGDRWARHYVIQDTFGKFACRLVGHGKTFQTDTNEFGCYRCFRIVQRGGREEK